MVLTPLMAIAALVAFRSSLNSGLRGLFALGAGGLYLLPWGIVYLIQDGDSAMTLALGGYLVVGWLLVVGANLQMALAHPQKFRRFKREAPIYRSFGRAPRLLPPFTIDRSWLLGGIFISALGVVLAIVRPENYLYPWALSLLGAFMIVASTGAFTEGMRRAGEGKNDS